MKEQRLLSTFLNVLNSPDLFAAEWPNDFSNVQKGEKKQKKPKLY